MTLAEALAEATANLDGVVSSQAGWSVQGIVFATLAGPRTAEFRLDPVVARAALGTPDTAASPRGEGWIAFTPVDLDRFALDRATAWLGSAYRNASRPAR